MNPSNLGIDIRGCLCRLCGKVWEWLEGMEHREKLWVLCWFEDTRLEKWSPLRNYRDRGSSHAPVLCGTLQCVASTLGH